MLTDHEPHAARPAEPTTHQPPDAIAVDEGEELVPTSRVSELVAQAERRARDGAFAEARRLFEKQRAELIAEHVAEKAALIAEVAAATRDLLQKGK